MQKVQSLTYDGIKQALVDKLKETNTFKGYDFGASGLNSVINLLAYNSHLIGFYVRMMLSESFVDSAKLKQSMLSHAKLTGYTYKGRRAAQAELFIRYDVPESQLPQDMKIIIPRGTTFDSNNAANNAKRTFVVIDDFVLTNVQRNVDVNGTPHARFTNTIDPITPLVVLEGEIETWRFIVPSDAAPHRFIIKRDGVDSSSIKVRVYETDTSDTFTVYTMAENSINVDGASPVFYVSTSEDGYFELIFGNNVFGKAVQAGNVIHASYVMSSGVSGNSSGTSGTWSNGTVPNTVSGRAPVVDVTWWNGRPDAYVNYVPVSTGGMDEETVEDLRFNIPHSYKRQNRIVTADDYKSAIIEKFRNVESINVWGGEDNKQREYGKVFVCIKPKYTNKLSQSAKQDIADNILATQGMVGSEVIFTDPDFININIDLIASYNKNKTDMGRGQVETNIAVLAREYEAKFLGTFDSNFSDVVFLNYIKERAPHLSSIFSRKTMRKDVMVSYAGQPEVEISFGNAVKPGVTSSSIQVNGMDLKFQDNVETGVIYLVKADGSRHSGTKYGSIDYKTGSIHLAFPYYFNIVGELNKGNTGVVQFTCTAVDPDINSYLNNIIYIDSVKVNANGKA